MASKISELTAVVTPADTDEFAINQAGTSKKMTRAQIRAGLAPSSDIVNVDQHDILARLSVGSGLPAGVAPGDLTEEATPTDGDFLLGWVGGELRKIDVANLPSTAGTQLSDLTDVGDTTATNRNVLVADGDSWEARALGTADIQSGTWADARVAQSNVTQHQAALAVTVSQVTDAGVLAALDTVGTNEIDDAAVTADKLADTAVTPGTYTVMTATVDQQGRITAASNGSGTDASGSRVATSTGALAVTSTDHEVTKGVTLTTDQANAVFTIAKTTAAGKIFKFNPRHDGATAVIADNAGSIDGVSSGTMRQINGGVCFLEIDSNAGSAPVCVTYGDVIHAPIEVSGTKTYDVNDSDQEFVLVAGAGTQTFPAVAGLPKGWRVRIVNESGGNITLAHTGGDSNVTLGNLRSALVEKAHTALVATGSFTGGVTTMDAS